MSPADGSGDDQRGDIGTDDEEHERREDSKDAEYRSETAALGRHAQRGLRRPAPLAERYDLETIGPLVVETLTGLAR